MVECVTPPSPGSTTTASAETRRENPRSPSNRPLLQGRPTTRASIIVVEHGTARHLPGCLEALFSSELPPDHFEVIVLDNASPTPIESGLRARFPHVRWLEARRNLGFAGGCGAAYRVARGVLIMSVNPDCEVHPGWIGSMLEPFASDARVGVVGGKLLYPGGNVLQHAGGRLFSNGRSEHIGEGEVDAGQHDAIRDVDYVCGAGFAVRRSTIEEVGFLSSVYFPAYYEETELCVRARAAGWRVVFTPHAIATHEQAVASGGAATAAYIERYHRGRTRFLLRNRLPSSLTQTVLGELAFLRAAPPAERTICVRAWLGSLRDAWRERPVGDGEVLEITAPRGRPPHPLRGARRRREVPARSRGEAE